MMQWRSTSMPSLSPPTVPTSPIPRSAPQGAPAGPTLAQPALPVQHRPPACGATYRLAADDAGGDTEAPLAVRLGVFPRGRRRMRRQARATEAWSHCYARRAASSHARPPSTTIRADPRSPGLAPRRRHGGLLASHRARSQPATPSQHACCPCLVHLLRALIGFWEQHRPLLPPQRRLPGKLAPLLLPGGIRVEGENQLLHLAAPVPAPALYATDGYDTGHACSAPRQRLTTPRPGCGLCEWKSRPPLIL